MEGSEMKYATKSYLVLFLLVLIAASCGPVTPVSTPANTSTSSFPTSTQIATATLTLTPTPQPGSTDYRLVAWSADDDYYLKLAETQSQEFYVGFNNSFQRYGPVFQAERLLREPSNDWRDTAWKIVANYPKGIPLPGMRQGQDLLAFLMEDLLNNEKISLEELGAIVQDRIQMHWECYRAQITESPLKQGNYLVVNKLFGDQQNGWIFYTGSCEGTAIYALRKTDNQYRIEKLRGWQALEMTAAGYHLSLDTAGDVNNNGLPEVVINVSFGASGTPPVLTDNVEFSEWDQSKEIFLNDSTERFEDVCDSFESCKDEWSIAKAPLQGIHPLIVKELHETMLDDIEGSSVCDHLVIEHAYLWYEGNFIEQKQTLLPASDEHIACQLSWALQVLNKKPAESAVATHIISEALAVWPDSMNEMWGPASKDYFALRLGLAYDLTGNQDKALALIQNVAEDPTHPDFDFASQLASTYLVVRSEQGKVQACQEINLLQTESELSEGPFVFAPLKGLKKKWGFGAWVWMYHIDDICDEKHALELSVQQLRPSQFETINQWLTMLGLRPLSIQTIFESDALTTWLVSLPSPYFRLAHDGTTLEKLYDQQLWLFSKSSNGINASYIDDIDQNTKLLTDYLGLDQSGFLVVLESIQPGFQRFFIFHVESNGEIQSQLYDYYVDGFVDHKTNEIMTIAGSYGSEQPEVAVYRWNAELERLDKRIINFDFARAQDEVERLVFQEHDYEQAILYINKFLIQAPPEPKEFLYCHYSDCTYYPDWYRPYMRYLLALAYELSGRQEQARDAYFLLWKDYPDNGFGLAAEHRLTQRRP
jgi:hypothetical protein